MDISEYAHKITSQLELLLEFFDIFTIGVTGTKGKSTTSTLIHKVLQDQGKKSMLLGNIGVPVFDFIEELTQDTIVVLEMSSHQLEYMKTSPNIAILLNIFPDHLDHYNSYEEYAKAKCNIYRHQKEGDYFLYNADNETIQKVIEQANGEAYPVSFLGKEESKIYLKEKAIFLENKSIYNTQEPRKLVGDYILNNILFVLCFS